MKWIAAQKGGREKYAIPRLLHQAGSLSCLYTDVWAKPHNPITKISKKISGRFHADLRNARVKTNPRLLLGNKGNDKNGRPKIDNAFDLWVSRKLDSAASHFFGYSYCSLKSFEAAKEKGIKTVLGQINPGPTEADKVREEFLRYSNGKHIPTIPSEVYWETWRQEIALTDTIVVNSNWSKDALMDVGINSNKIAIVPLVYDRGINKNGLFKSYAGKTKLKLLYLGAVGIRKGFHYLKEAMKLLVNEPVELHVVGRLNGPEELLQGLTDNIVYHGSVAPIRVDQFFKESDVFVFPTLSDGFGLTQLEAQYHKLPILSSKYCAEIVKHDVNGWILEDVNTLSIVEGIQTILNERTKVEEWSFNSIDMNSYSVAEIGKKILSL